MTTVATVVGNPKPQSRTFHAASLVAEQLTGIVPQLTVDLAVLGASLLDWADPAVADLVSRISDADVLIVASPTYKATYTGLLKLFLDRFAADSLNGVVAIPLMLGGSPTHALAPEVHLKPVLVEIGATCPTRGLYIIDKQYDDAEALAPWLANARRQVAASARV